MIAPEITSSDMIVWGCMGSVLLLAFLGFWLEFLGAGGVKRSEMRQRRSAEVSCTENVYTGAFDPSLYQQPVAHDVDMVEGHSEIYLKWENDTRHYLNEKWIAEENLRDEALALGRAADAPPPASDDDESGGWDLHNKDYWTL